MKGEEEPPRSRRPEAFPLIIAVIVWGIIVMLFFFPDMGKRTNWDFDQWLNVGYLVIFICLVVAAVSKYTFGPAADEVEQDEAVERTEQKAGTQVRGAPKKATTPATAKTAKPVAKPPAKPKTATPKTAAPKAVTVAADDDAAEGTAARSPAPVRAPEPALKIVEWPLKRPGGVYADTFIPVGRELVLNTRTELGRVCGNCEELPACGRLVSGRVPEDVFEWNFECKEGLKRELGRMRKAKLAETAAMAKEQQEQQELQDQLDQLEPQEPQGPSEGEEVPDIEPEVPEPPEPEIASPPAYRDRKASRDDGQQTSKARAQVPQTRVSTAGGHQEVTEVTEDASQVAPAAPDDTGPAAPAPPAPTEEGEGTDEDASAPGADETEQDGATGPEPEPKAKPKVKKKVKRRE